MKSPGQCSVRLAIAVAVDKMPRRILCGVSVGMGLQAAEMGCLRKC